MIQYVHRIAVLLPCILAFVGLIGLAEISEEAEALLTEALDIIEQHALRTERISWERWRETALQRAEDAQATEDVYPIIQETLHRLRDNHSFFVASAASDYDGYTPVPPPLREPTGTLASDEIAQLIIPNCSGLYDSETLSMYSAILHQLIVEFRAQGVRGWIVDLRLNTGGNMWPMIAGLGPILGEGIAGYFVFPGPDTREAWGYMYGASFLEEERVFEIDPISLAATSDPLPPIAVLIGPRTSSSGEATAVAFIGREQTRLFGRATAGLSTVNDGFRLSDGSGIVLTVGVFADRSGSEYGYVINPDEVVSPTGSAQDGDSAIAAAVDWLQHQLGPLNE